VRDAAVVGASYVALECAGFLSGLKYDTTGAVLASCFACACALERRPQPEGWHGQGRSALEASRDRLGGES
jgi:hypothetical protein